MDGWNTKLNHSWFWSGSVHEFHAPPQKTKVGNWKMEKYSNLHKNTLKLQRKKESDQKAKNFLSKEDSFESTSNLLYLSFFKKWHFGISDRAVSCRSYSCSSFRHIWSFLHSLLGWDGSFMQRTRWPWNRWIGIIRWSTVYKKNTLVFSIHFQYPMKKYIPGIPKYLTALVSESVPFGNQLLAPPRILGCTCNRNHCRCRCRQGCWSFLHRDKKKSKTISKSLTFDVIDVKNQNRIPSMYGLFTYIYHIPYMDGKGNGKNDDILHPIFFRQICRGLFVLNLLMWLGYVCTATRRRSAAIGS